MKTPQWIAAHRLRVHGLTLTDIAQHGGFHRSEFHRDLSRRPAMLVKVMATIDELERKQK